MKWALSVFIIGVTGSVGACGAKQELDHTGVLGQVTAPIVGGTDAAPGEFPWQLSMQRQSAAGVWTHTCGAILLGSGYALSAAHCVEGVEATKLRIVAGLHDQSNLAGTQTVAVASYTKHEAYNAGPATYANDIAIINFGSAISIGGNIQPATLPADNSNSYLGLTAVIDGWGRTSSSSTLPNSLQKASIQVIGTAECNSLLAPISGATVGDNQICVYDSANNVGACSGDGGSPLNAPDGVTRAAGIASFGAFNGGSCLQTYPTVYTRTSAYLAWIASNTP